MPLRIQTNQPSQTAQRLLQLNASDVRARLERLSSGLRINRAADDAAGLAVSEGLRADLAGSRQGARNAKMAVNQLRTAEGALDQTSGMLVRMRELAVQASSSTLGAAGRQAAQAEFNQLSAEVDRQAARTADASPEGPVATIQTGSETGDGDRLEVTVPEATASSLGLEGASVSSASDARATVTSVDQAIDRVTSARGQLGAFENRLRSGIRSSEVAAENQLASEATTRDADIAAEASALSRSSTLTQAGLGALQQANRLPGQALDLLG